MESMQVPGVNMNALMEARRKDVEALIAANQQAYAGMQAMAKHQAKIMQETMQQWQSAAAGLMSEKNPAEGIGQQGEMADPHRRWPVRISALFLATLLVTASHGQMAEKIVIDGSTGVMPLVASLAKAFQERNSAVIVEIGKGLGTQARLQTLAEGKIDIALASHGLNMSEITRHGMAVLEIARVPVVFGVNATVPVANLTNQQICDVYRGKVSNWQALGGPLMEIAARTRPDNEVDAEVVRANIACLKDLEMPETVKVMPRSGDMARELAATTGAIGMTTMTVVEQSQGKIRALSIDGIDPSAQNVERKAYPLVRESFFVIKAPPSPAVARFLEFAKSSMGHSVITANGAIAVK